jgi:hypothetical protein
MGEPPIALDILRARGSICDLRFQYCRAYCAEYLQRGPYSIKSRGQIGNCDSSDGRANRKDKSEIAMTCTVNDQRLWRKVCQQSSSQMIARELAYPVENRRGQSDEKRTGITILLKRRAILEGPELLGPLAEDILRDHPQSYRLLITAHDHSI